MEGWTLLWPWRQARRYGLGFSLIELMVAVAIIGVLASVAIPALSKYVKKARSAEPLIFVKKIADGARAYFYDSTSRSPGMQQVQASLPGGSTNFTADPNCCAMGGWTESCLPSQSLWETPTWRLLHFSLDDPHRYAYQYAEWFAAFGTWEYVAVARGDLDCDREQSSFMLIMGHRFGTPGAWAGPAILDGAPHIQRSAPLE